MRYFSTDVTDLFKAIAWAVSFVGLLIGVLFITIIRPDIEEREAAQDRTAASEATMAEDQYWHYHARCRNCSERMSWVVAKTTPWASFYRITMEHHGVPFTEHCEFCKEFSIFDLTHMSPDPERE